jgi:hypothetical protein
LRTSCPSPAKCGRSSIADNGTTVAEGDATTNEDGNLMGTFKISNLEGTDTIDLLATDTVTGETCFTQLVLEG